MFFRHPLSTALALSTIPITRQTVVYDDGYPSGSIFDPSFYRTRCSARSAWSRSIFDDPFFQPSFSPVLGAFGLISSALGHGPSLGALGLSDDLVYPLSNAEPTTRRIIRNGQPFEVTFKPIPKPTDRMTAAALTEQCASASEQDPSFFDTLKDIRSTLPPGTAESFFEADIPFDHNPLYQNCTKLNSAIASAVQDSEGLITHLTREQAELINSLGKRGILYDHGLAGSTYLGRDIFIARHDQAMTTALTLTGLGELGSAFSKFTDEEAKTQATTFRKRIQKALDGAKAANLPKWPEGVVDEAQKTDKSDVPPESSAAATKERMVEAVKSDSDSEPEK